MKKKLFIILAIILTSFLVFKLGHFHFSKTQGLVRDVPSEKLNTMEDVWWKFSTGDRQITESDILKFGKSDSFVKNNTVYISQKPVAKITRFVYRCFMDYELTLQSFDGSKTVYYVSK